MPSRRPPRWTDEANVVEFVKKELIEDELEEERLHYTHYLPQIQKGYEQGRIEPVIYNTAKWQRKIEKQAEKQAVEAALRGDTRPLASLLAPFKTPSGGIEVSPVINRLSPTTWSLVIQFLIGQRNLKTGRLKGERGRPPLGAETRRKINPLHNAKDSVPAVESILRCSYPDQSLRKVKARAKRVAAGLAGVHSHQILIKHMSRRPGDRRLLPG